MCARRKNTRVPTLVCPRAGQKAETDCVSVVLCAASAQPPARGRLPSAHAPPRVHAAAAAAAVTARRKLRCTCLQLLSMAAAARTAALASGSAKQHTRSASPSRARRRRSAAAQPKTTPVPRRRHTTALQTTQPHAPASRAARCVSAAALLSAGTAVLSALQRAASSEGGGGSVERRTGGEASPRTCRCVRRRGRGCTRACASRRRSHMAARRCTPMQRGAAHAQNCCAFWLQRKREGAKGRRRGAAFCVHSRARPYVAPRSTPARIRCDGRAATPSCSAAAIRRAWASVLHAPVRAQQAQPARAHPLRRSTLQASVRTAEGAWQRARCLRRQPANV
jgi:hypothetical protein